MFLKLFPTVFDHVALASCPAGEGNEVMMRDYSFYSNGYFVSMYMNAKIQDIPAEHCVAKRVLIFVSCYGCSVCVHMKILFSALKIVFRR